MRYQVKVYDAVTGALKVAAEAVTESSAIAKGQALIKRKKAISAVIYDGPIFHCYA